MNKKIKVVQLLLSGLYSGAENVALTIIEEMNKYTDLFEFYYVSPHGVIEDICRERNINHIAIEQFSILEIRKAMKKVEPDIIHAHDSTASIKVSIAYKKATILSHIHNNNPIMKSKNLKSFLYLFCSKKFSKIITVSESVINEFVYSKKLKVSIEKIGNPIPFDKIKPYIVDKKNIDIIFVGRFESPKNPLRYIEICKKVSKIIPELKCVMVGDGKLYEELNKTVSNEGLDFIKFNGFILEPYNFISSSRILLMTSSWEGYGLVAIESMVLGTIPVVNNVGGLPALVKSDYGYVFNDDEEAVNEIVKLLTNTEYYDKKSISLKNNVSQMNNDLYFNELIKIYLSILDRGE